MAFLNKDFLLTTKTAQRLYHEVAADLPIIDYHCHLPPNEVAQNRRFETLYDIWLAGDHYKWRAMRTNGVEEKFVTGDADPYEKFLAWCRTVPATLRNPLYHWSHLELRRYFGIDTLISEDTAKEIWDAANKKLAEKDFSAHGILKKFKVQVVCSTDDPTDNLEHHRACAADSSLETKVLPTFRPDKATNLSDPAAFVKWVQALEVAADTAISNFADFKAALASRHDLFHAQGGRLSDHGLTHCPRAFASEAEAAQTFQKARSGAAVSAAEAEAYAGHLMLFFGELDHARGWTKQLHLGAMRNNNRGLFAKLGPDIGCDSIGDYPQGEGLSAYLGQLSASGKLPKTILYNLNPADNYLFATMVGNFQDGGEAGKVQFGSGWWFLDQLEAMQWQINALSNLGLLRRFVGMLTDSRSFLSYPRHEYFRRLLCQIIGNDVEQGLIPDQWELYAPLVADVSHGNAAKYFGF